MTARERLRGAPWAGVTACAAAASAVAFATCVASCGSSSGDGSSGSEQSSAGPGQALAHAAGSAPDGVRVQRWEDPWSGQRCLVFTHDVSGSSNDSWSVAVQCAPAPRGSESSSGPLEPGK